MKRLFLSLYIAVAVGLLIINWTGEFLWQKLQSQNKVEYSQTLSVIGSLIKPYAVSFDGDSEFQTLQNIRAQVPYPVEVSHMDDFAFLPSHMEVLAQGEPIFLFNVDENATFYVPIPKDRLLSIGPIKVTAEHSDLSLQQSILSIVSYIMLGALILFWSWPLWRDLTEIRRLTEKVSSGHLDVKSKLKPRSVVFPLGIALSNMAKKINSLLDFQKQMMQAVSHDIRTPLARLKFSIAVADNTSGPAVSKVHQDMLRDVAEVELLVDEILTFGRLESAEIALNIETVNINLVCQDVVKKLNTNSRRKIDLNCEPNIHWQCDLRLLERALQNLLTNAQRYAKKKVSLNVQLESKYLTISIADDGKGIAKENQDKIFEPFSRLEKSRNKESGGFGLGLAIVEKIVAWHQGIIRIDQSHEPGAKFVITLPKIKSSEIK